MFDTNLHRAVGAFQTGACTDAKHIRSAIPAA
jgi:hypothetical protein